MLNLGIFRKYVPKQKFLFRFRDTETQNQNQRQDTDQVELGVRNRGGPEQSLQFHRLLRSLYILTPLLRSLFFNHLHIPVHVHGVQESLKLYLTEDR